MKYVIRIVKKETENIQTENIHDSCRLFCIVENSWRHGKREWWRGDGGGDDCREERIAIECHRGSNKMDQVTNDEWGRETSKNKEEDDWVVWSYEWIETKSFEQDGWNWIADDERIIIDRGRSGDEHITIDWGRSRGNDKRDAYESDEKEQELDRIGCASKHVKSQGRACDF